MSGIHTLTIGYTKDRYLAEEIARATGAKELIILTCLEGNSLHLDTAERKEWIRNGWTLDGKKAHKILKEVSTEEDEEQKKKETGETKQESRKHWIQRASSHEGYSEGGRLKAYMQVKGQLKEEE